MKQPTVVTSGQRGRRILSRCPALILPILATLALAGCSGFSNLSSDDAPIPSSQSNLASLTEVIQKHPDDPQAYNMRGSVYADAGNPEAALADFNKATGLDPNYAQAYANRGLLYRQNGKFCLLYTSDAADE